MARKKKQRRKAGRAAVTQPTRAVAEKEKVVEVTEQSVWRWASWALITALLLLAAAAWSTRKAPTDRVWNAEHGHYHDIFGNELKEATTTTQAVELDAAPQPTQVGLGETPWQNEPNLPRTEGVLPPPGPPPPGKVWSSQHGHWHDDPQAQARIKARQKAKTKGKAKQKAAPMLPPESVLPPESTP